MEVVRLPVTETKVVLRSPAGADDLLLLEAGPPDLRVALALLERLARDEGGAPIDAAALPLTDVDALLLALRRQVVGDRVRADTTCAGCRARVDLSFSVGEYLAHNAPVATLPPGSEPGWYALGDGIEVRAPRASDQLAIAGDADPEAALLARCVRPAARAAEVQDRVEAALEELAPDLCGQLAATCPECGAAVAAVFDPLQYTLRELRDRATWLYEDVAWIAHHYHWSEAEILALPAARRARYAELAADHARVARGG